MPMHPIQAGPREVKLTFDDGPNPATTPDLLDKLKQFGLKATFFVLGQNIARPQGRALLERMVAEGHQVGNHSYTHPDLTKLDPKQVEDEIKKTADLIGSLDHGIKLLRPPYGAHNAAVDEVAKNLGYRLVFWNVDSMDWHKDYRNGAWVEHAMEQIREGHNCTVLAHDIHPTTVAHFPELVEAVKQLPDTEFAQLT